MRLTHMSAIGLIVVAVGVLAGAPNQPAEVSQSYTSDFGLETNDRLLPDGANDFFSLNPGHVRRYEGDKGSDFVELVHTVLKATCVIKIPAYPNSSNSVKAKSNFISVTTRVIEEREWINGEIAEVTLNYYARDPRNNNIYYFGEDVDIYEDGEVVSHEGSWLAGRDGARAGLVMPGAFLIGSRYYQEMAPLSLDRAEHLQMGLDVSVPAGRFSNCVMLVDTTPLEPDEETIKIYAPGVGLILEDDIVLIDYRN